MPFEHHNNDYLSVDDDPVERTLPIDCSLDSECSSSHSSQSINTNCMDVATNKRRKISEDANHLQVSVKVLRLPEPCPVPTTFSKEVSRAIEDDNVTGLIKDRLKRQIGTFYYGICPKPSPSEYTIMAKTVCQKYTQLQDKKTTRYWVSLICMRLHIAYRSW